MKKIYHLSTCDTCKKILKEINAPQSYTLQDIKTNPLTEDDLEELKKLTGSYEKLFSKRARLYKERDLKNKQISEQDYKTLLLEHYTFLKRPVVVNGNEIFTGNSKKTVEAAKNSLHE